MSQKIYRIFILPSCVLPSNTSLVLLASILLYRDTCLPNTFVPGDQLVGHLEVLRGRGLACRTVSRHLRQSNKMSGAGPPDFNSPEYEALMAQYSNNFQSGEYRDVYQRDPTAPVYSQEYNYEQEQRDDRGGRGRGRGGRGGGSTGTGIPPPKDPDTIYVSNMPPRVSKEEIGDYFGSIGIIKRDRKTQELKINLYTDKNTGEMKGDCTITFDDPPSATAAIDWFNNKEWKGSVVKVSMAAQKEYIPPVGGRGRGGYGGAVGGGGRGGFGGGGGGFGGGFGGGRGGGGRGGGGGGGGGDPGDWTCPGCGNTNWARRHECNKCHMSKPGGGGDGGGRGGYGGGRGGYDGGRGGYDGGRGGYDGGRGGYDGGRGGDRGGYDGGRGGDRGGYDDRRGGDRGYDDRSGGRGGDRGGDRGGYDDRSGGRGGRGDDSERFGVSDYSSLTKEFLQTPLIALILQRTAIMLLLA
ncbi:putative RNA-binding protein cabeza [Planoprotostelium fungivorum]|uniref:Putative RNA-binding protein cabeza n=1 Tax=Planoprotostelium fungivorum TaxID=1890364 RepID=A0A2P6N358_9EUKA|nr:putative RNA-binding protein cabeza [Planoprotostelium fungivorum]